MSDTTREYTNGTLAVVWKPALCVHSRLCWTQLSTVFNPRNRPWVNMEGAETEAIKAQVDRCPSGALSWYDKQSESQQSAPEVEGATIVEVSANGPLLIYGNLTIRNADGTESSRHKVTALCRCGASANKPFCDGSHVGLGFRDPQEPSTLQDS
jgi:uncharacterized Fe-S cluster protein YjdI/CDGSH-type Zn-finger protein